MSVWDSSFNTLWLSLCGALFVIFRIWVTEVKLRKELGNKRGHTSRFISLFFFIAMLLNFENNVFTLISVVGAPAMLMAFFAFDVPYYIKDVRLIKEKKFWLILERLTMHPPAVIFAVYFYSYARIDFYLTLFTIPKFCGALILVVGPLFLFDPRVTKREDWPRGPACIIGAILSIVGNLIFYFQKKMAFIDVLTELGIEGLL